jgi:hypothetical protein
MEELPVHPIVGFLKVKLQDEGREFFGSKLMQDLVKS